MAPERETLERAREQKRSGGPRPPAASKREPGAAGDMLQLQQSAGNRAVAQAVAAQKKTDASSMALQLGAVWNDLVVLPLAHADEKLTRDKPVEEEALADIELALRGITTIRSGTPAEDPNRARLEMLELRVTGLRDLVQERIGKGKSRAKFEMQMIEWRAEATAIEPELRHGPKVPEEADDTGAQAPHAQKTGDQAPDGAKTGAAAEAAKETEEPMTVAQLWHELVVDNLWQGQQLLDAGADKGQDAWFRFTSATRVAGYFALGTPRDDPNRLRLERLHTGLDAISDIVGEKARVLDDLPVRAVEVAFDLAQTMGRQLLGQPVEDDSDSDSQAAQPGEPEFTWEGESREKKPFANDTELERP